MTERCPALPSTYNIDPVVAHERARKAALARETTDHHIQRIVDRAPSLTAEQIERLRSLLTPVRDADSA
jgi:hypothetical protein